MRKLQKITACIFLCLAVLAILPAMPAHAKTKVTEVADSGLKNVKNANVFPGQWVSEQGRYRFICEDGTSPQNCWINAGGSIYYLDNEGYRVTGWISYGDNLYYTNENGKLRTGWLKLDDKKYYLKEDNGRLATGFCQIGEHRYFFSQIKGVLQTGRWLKLDGEKYYLKENGRVATGFYRVGENKYFFSLIRGALRTGRWLKLDDEKYYLKENGRVATGFYRIGEYKYFFSQIKGVLQTERWLKLDDKKYYLKENGKVATGLYKIGDNTFYFSPTSGAMQTGWQTVNEKRYYFDVNTGVMATSKWVQEGNDYHYLNSSGVMVKSDWVTDGDKKYYMDSNGVKTTGTIKINEKFYHFDEDGVYLPNLLGGIIDASKPMVALTFDDGPGKYTGRLLDCLKKYNAKASFFMVGSCVSRYPDFVKRMAEYGCDLGNHSYDHPYFTRLSQSSRKSQVSKTSSNIKKACGKYPTLFRLPYGDGAFSKTVLSDLGLPSIYWSLDTRDYMYLSDSQHTVNAVLNQVKSGDIILMHDIHYSTVVAAEKIIPALIKKGYQLVTVSELAKYKGKTTLTAGKTYTGFR